MTPWRSPHERWRRQKTGGGNAEIAARFPHYHRHDGYGITSPKPAHYGIRILRARSDLSTLAASGRRLPERSGGGTSGCTKGTTDSGSIRVIRRGFGAG